MRLRTFHASNMKQAMEMIREELGDSAIIISSNKNASGKGVAVTVAQEDMEDEYHHASATSPHGYDSQNVYEFQDRDIIDDTHDDDALYTMPDYIVRDIEDKLYRQGVAAEVLDELLHVISTQQAPHDTSEESLHHVLTTALRQTFRFSSIPFTQTGLRMMVVGTPGAGKTLLIAKTAARIVKAGHRVTVITTDYKRAGGVEQLASFTDILKVKLHVANTRAELKALLAQIPPSERVLMDSAGANPYDYQELKDLSEFAGLMGVEPVLVFPAGNDPEEAAEVARAFSFLGVERMCVTRMDLARRHGSILTAAHAAGLAFSYGTGTEQVLGECGDLTPEKLASLLLTTKSHG